MVFPHYVSVLSLLKFYFKREKLWHDLPEKLIDCKLLDSDGAVLECFAASSKVNDGHLITFDPVPKPSFCHLKRNITYCICVSAHGQRVGFLSGEAHYIYTSFYSSCRFKSCLYSTFLFLWLAQERPRLMWYIVKELSSPFVLVNSTVMD